MTLSPISAYARPFSSPKQPPSAAFDGRSLIASLRRAWLGAAIERAIELLDALDGDPDLEAGSDAEPDPEGAERAPWGTGAFA